MSLLRDAAHLKRNDIGGALRVWARVLAGTDAQIRSDVGRVLILSQDHPAELIRRMKQMGEAK